MSDTPVADAMDRCASIRAADPEVQDVLQYEADAFGGPRNVYLNGTRLKAVQRIETRHIGQEFSEVTIVLAGTSVTVAPVG